MIKNVKHLTTAESFKYLISCCDNLTKVDKEIGTYCYNAVTQMNLAGSPASTKWHHVYDGGLLVHTAEVLIYAISLGESFCDPLEMTVSAILHDHMKIKDYAKNDEGVWEKTEHGKKVYHITHGYACFFSAFKEHPNTKLIEAIGHNIVSHHGRPEWGSYCKPQTATAEILHLADGFSVHYGPGRDKPAEDKRDE